MGMALKDMLVQFLDTGMPTQGDRQGCESVCVLIAMCVDVVVVGSRSEVLDCS